MIRTIITVLLVGIAAISVIIGLMYGAWQLAGLIADGGPDRVLVITGFIIGTAVTMAAGAFITDNLIPADSKLRALICPEL